MLGKKVESFSARCSSSRHAVARCSVWSCGRSRGTSFADTRLIPRSWVSIACHVPNDKLSSSAISLTVKRRSARITALTRSTISLVRDVDGRSVCGSSSMDVRPFLNREYHSNILDRLNLFLRMLVVAFRTFLWPSYQVSGRTWFKHVAPSPHLFHNTMEGQTRLHYRSTHSRLSQAATRSSGVWRQEMLPSILHGCHFDTISSLSLKNVVPDIFLSDLV
jgi:hypothetical protein